MPTVTPASPLAHGNLESTLGLSYVFAAKDIDIAMSDQLDIMGLGLARLVGSFEGSGSDTMRVTFVDGVGFDRPMTAIAGETDAITPSSPTYGYSEVSLAQYGLGYADTYKQQLLSREPAALTEYLVSTIVPSWIATLRSLVLTAGSTISLGVGSAATALSIDDFLDLGAARRATSGAKRPICALAGIQVTQAIESARQEPAYQSSVAAFLANSAISEENVHRNFLGLGVDVAESNDVVDSGGGRVGFAMAPGGIGWAGADPSRIKAAGKNPIFIPQYGILIEEITEGAGQSTRQTNARVFLGVEKGDPLVFFGRKMTSINT